MVAHGLDAPAPTVFPNSQGRRQRSSAGEAQSGSLAALESHPLPSKVRDLREMINFLHLCFLAVKEESGEMESSPGTSPPFFLSHRPVSRLPAHIGTGTQTLFLCLPCSQSSRATNLCPAAYKRQGPVQLPGRVLKDEALPSSPLLSLLLERGCDA